MTERGKNGTNTYTGLRDNEGTEVTTSYAWVAQKVQNLNRLKILNHDGPAESINVDPITSECTTVYFRNIEQAIVQHIEQSDAIIGCVAWLTSKAILAALAKKDPVSIVVQKEDFLRPDVNSKGAWAKELRRRYDALMCSWPRGSLGVWLSTFGDETVQPVRCVGNFNRDKSPAFPRMHHKFILFCKHEGQWIDPYAVWTGSFNFTENAGRSLENALYITQPDIINAYHEEWKRVVSLSEPLDWESDWVAPEWRLGT